MMLLTSFVNSVQLDVFLAQIILIVLVAKMDIIILHLLIHVLNVWINAFPVNQGLFVTRASLSIISTL